MPCSCDYPVIVDEGIPGYSGDWQVFTVCAGCGENPTARPMLSRDKKPRRTALERALRKAARDARWAAWRLDWNRRIRRPYGVIDETVDPFYRLAVGTVVRVTAVYAASLAEGPAVRHGRAALTVGTSYRVVANRPETGLPRFHSKSSGRRVAANWNDAVGLQFVAVDGTDAVARYFVRHTDVRVFVLSHGENPDPRD